MKISRVYMITNQGNKVIYVGVTSNLARRIYQHKTKFYPRGFTAKYNCEKLVYFDQFNDISNAMAREKQLKSGNRKPKEQLIHSMNPEWKDLSDGWLFYFN